VGPALRAETLLERQLRALAADEVGGAGATGSLSSCGRLEQPDLAINDADFLKGDGLVLVNSPLAAARRASPST